MFDEVNKSPEAEENNDGAVVCIALSFKQKRIARKQGRYDRRRKAERQKGLSLKHIRRGKSAEQEIASGPTAQTRAKLIPDPLRCFKKKNILDNNQIQSFQRIRRAISIITEDSRLRVSQFNQVMVDCRHSSRQPQGESDYEISLKDHYSRWIDRMTAVRCQAGPVLDIIIDEMSLRAVDRKWGKRKGWAKHQLQTALNLYPSLF